MKTWIVAMAMMMGVSMTAQEHGKRHDRERGPGKEHREPFTPEQSAELRAKKLTLDLDLSDKQQGELQKLFLANAQDMKNEKELRKANREAGKKPSIEDRFAMQNKMLDKQIASNRQIKKILNAEQFAKFEKMKHHRSEKFKKKAKQLKKQHRR